MLYNYSGYNFTKQIAVHMVKELLPVKQIVHGNLTGQIQSLISRTIMTSGRPLPLSLSPCNFHAFHMGESLAQ